MLTTHPSSVFQKRDLHVGGLGSSASGALAAVTEPVHDAADEWLDAADTWLERVRDAAEDADDYVRNNPWTALTVAAVVGLAAGYLLARRS